MFEQATRLAATAADRLLPASLWRTIRLRAFALANIPLLYFLKPQVLALDEDKCVVRIPLTRRSRNHLGSMYMGALVAGADLAGGLLAMELIYRSGEPVSLVFKDVHGEFLRRAHGDVTFRCEEGAALESLVGQAIDTGERVEHRYQVTATCPGQHGEPEEVARFWLTVSLKLRVRP